MPSARTNTSGVNGIAVFVTVVGGIILVSGLTNKKISQVVLGFLQGTAPTADILPDTGGAAPSGAVYTAGEHSGGYGGTISPGGTPSVNKGIGKLLAAPYGWSTGAEWDALDKLWTRESGWRNDIANSSSGAFGIAQALGHGTVSSTARNVHVRFPGGGSAVQDVNEYPSKLANSGNASAQIAWGLAYIRQRYGSPTAAWAHEEANSWY
jgi:hypothetical protein